VFITGSIHSVVCSLFTWLPKQLSYTYNSTSSFYV